MEFLVKDNLDWLEEILVQFYETTYESLDDEENERHFNEAKQAITLKFKEEITKARIKELEKLQIAHKGNNYIGGQLYFSGKSLPGERYNDGWYSLQGYLDTRLNQLKSALRKSL